MPKLAKEDVRLIKEAVIMLFGILAAWFLLQGRVKALEVKVTDMFDRGVGLREDFETATDGIREDVKIIRENQIIIGTQLGITGLK